MKTLFLVFMLSSFPVLVNAQSKSTLIFVNALEKNKKMQNTGTIITIIGGATLFVGNIMYWKVYNDYNNEELPEDKLSRSRYIMLGGLGLMAVGIPLWAVGSVKERHIKLEAQLVKLKGTTSIYGIGIKIRF